MPELLADETERSVSAIVLQAFRSEEHQPLRPWSRPAPGTEAILSSVDAKADALLAALGGLVALACATAPPAEEPERPPARSLVRISEVATIGPYLDADSRVNASRCDSSSANENCLALIRRSRGALPAPRDPRKHRRRGEAAMRADRGGLASGVARSPAAPALSAPDSRVQVEFRTIFEGEDQVLVRGASHWRWRSAGPQPWTRWRCFRRIPPARRRGSSGRPPWSTTPKGRSPSYWWERRNCPIRASRTPGGGLIR